MTTEQNSGKREAFGSRAAFILASVGGALGLGNVWKFPYMVGKNGGAAFILIYLLCLFFIATPILMTEIALGRKTQTGYTGALRKLLPNTQWKRLGIIGVFSMVVTLSFYGGVSGWTIAYIFKSLSGSYAGQSAAFIGEQFGKLITSPYETVVWFSVMMAITMFIVVKGVKGGIEKVCNILLPILFVLIIFLGIRSVMLPGAITGIKFYLLPDFSKVTGATFIAAVGQAFFTLGVGCGNLAIYGSYLDRKKTLTPSTILVAAGDTLAAILFGFIIFPAVFAYGIEPSVGPPLVFITLPAIFAQMKFGMFFATTFFILLFFACLTSTICILEAIVGFGVDEWNWTRKKSTKIMGLTVFILGAIQMLSFGPLSNVTILGYSIFDFSNDVLVSTILLPLGGLLMVILVGWVIKPENLLDEINTGEGMKVEKYYIYTIKYIAPFFVGIMFITMLKSLF